MNFEVSTVIEQFLHIANIKLYLYSMAIVFIIELYNKHKYVYFAIHIKKNSCIICFNIHIQKISCIIYVCIKRKR